MTITVEAKPVHLTWDNFKPVDEVDGDEVAQVNPEAIYPKNIKVEKDGDQARLASFKITVKPNPANTLIEKTADKTPELLRHEQAHFDLLLLSTRVAARELDAARAASGSELGTLVAEIQKTHAERADKIDKAYDAKTRNGRDRLIQAQWELEISKALADPKGTKVQSMDL